jgi:hypothetical protein
MPDTNSAYDRYRASVAVRRDCQDARDALGGYVDSDHPDHANNSTPARRQAICDADAALHLATTQLDAAFAAYRRIA